MAKWLISIPTHSGPQEDLEGVSITFSSGSLSSPALFYFFKEKPSSDFSLLCVFIFV